MSFESSLYNVLPQSMIGSQYMSDVAALYANTMPSLSQMPQLLPMQLPTVDYSQYFTPTKPSIFTGSFASPFNLGNAGIDYMQMFGLSNFNNLSKSTTSAGGGMRVDSGKYDQNFLKRVKEIAQELNCDYKDLLGLINSESTFSTTAGYNKRTGKIGCAVGLIQFTKPAIDALNRTYGLNLTKEKILQMSPMEQLELSGKCLKLLKKSAGYADNARLSAGDLYAINFLPARAKGEVLCRSGEKGNSYYSQNKGLDLDGDGNITKSELAQRIADKRVDESSFSAVA